MRRRPICAELGIANGHPVSSHSAHAVAAGTATAQPARPGKRWVNCVQRADHASLGKCKIGCALGTQFGLRLPCHGPDLARNTRILPLRRPNLDTNSCRLTDSTIQTCTDLPPPFRSKILLETSKIVCPSSLFVYTIGVSGVMAGLVERIAATLPYLLAAIEGANLAGSTGGTRGS